MVLSVMVLIVLLMVSGDGLSREGLLDVSEKASESLRSSGGKSLDMPRTPYRSSK